jgi:hypothetical protein
MMGVGTLPGEKLTIEWPRPGSRLETNGRRLPSGDALGRPVSGDALGWCEPSGGYVCRLGSPGPGGEGRERRGERIRIRPIRTVPAAGP